MATAGNPTSLCEKNDEGRKGRVVFLLERRGVNGMVAHTHTTHHSFFEREKKEGQGDLSSREKRRKGRAIFLLERKEGRAGRSFF